MTAAEQIEAILEDPDEWGRPRVKPPDCPRCGEDELAVLGDLLVMCYGCGWSLGHQ